MKGWQEALLHVLQTSGDEGTLFAAVAVYARNLGFDHCAYGARLPLPIAEPRTVMLNDYPAAWQVRYQEQGYLQIDPVVQHGARSLRPVIWDDALFAPSRPLWEDARSFGLRFGWSQSSRNASGVMGLLSLSRDGEPVTKAERRALEPQLMWLTQTAHLGISKVLTARELPEMSADLTRREVEVLRWTADGKTSSEIGGILHLSERTVNFHLSNAADKLRAPNRTAAVIRAAMLGLLF